MAFCIANTSSSYFNITLMDHFQWYGSKNPSHMPAPQQAAQVQQEQLVQVAKDQLVQKRVDSLACPFVGPEACVAK